MKLSAQQQRILDLAADNGGTITQRELLEAITDWPARKGRTGAFRHSTLDRAEYARVRASLSRAIRRLEERGLVARRKHPAAVQLTEAGVAFCATEGATA